MKRVPLAGPIESVGATATITFSPKDCARMSARINVENWIALAKEFGVPGSVRIDLREINILPSDTLPAALRREFPELFSHE